MSGDNSLNIEVTLAGSHCRSGYTKSLLLPLGMWFDANDDPLGASTVPSLEDVATNARCAKWDHDESAAIRTQLVVPDDFVNDSNHMKLQVMARKVDGTDENTDLALQATVRFLTPGVAATIAFTSLATPATALLSGSDDGTTFGNMAIYELDLGARLKAEGIHPSRGDIMVIELGPNEAVGTTDMDLQVVDCPLLIYQSHVSLFDRSDRLIKA